MNSPGSTPAGLEESGGQPDRLRTRPRRDEVKEAVLRAALEEFAERGYAAATVESIAARAGFTKGAVYGNFDGKFGLILELLGPDRMGRADFQAGLGGEPGDPDASLRHIASELHRIAQDPLPTLVMAEARGHAVRTPTDAAAFAEVRAEVIDHFAAGLQRELERVGLEPTVPVRELLCTTLALVSGHALERVGVDEPVISVEVFERILRALVAPV